MLIAPQLIYSDNQPIDAKISRSIKAVSANDDKDCPIKGQPPIFLRQAVRATARPAGMWDDDMMMMMIRAEKGERWFCSEPAAIASGWRKAPTPQARWQNAHGG